MDNNLFPSNEYEALAMFYVQNVVFPSLPEDQRTPKVLMKEYMDSVYAFREACGDMYVENQGDEPPIVEVFSGF